MVKIINEEEQQFLKTLARGRRLFNRTADKHKEDKVIPGQSFCLVAHLYSCLPLFLKVIQTQTVAIFGRG